VGVPDSGRRGLLQDPSVAVRVSEVGKQYAAHVLDPADVRTPPKKFVTGGGHVRHHQLQPLQASWRSFLCQ
jgi:hypothetical protein